MIPFSFLYLSYQSRFFIYFILIGSLYRLKHTFLGDLNLPLRNTHTAIIGCCVAVSLELKWISLAWIL